MCIKWLTCLIIFLKKVNNVAFLETFTHKTLLLNEFASFKIIYNAILPLKQLLTYVFNDFIKISLWVILHFTLKKPIFGSC